MSSQGQKLTLLDVKHSLKDLERVLSRTILNFIDFIDFIDFIQVWISFT